MGAEFAAAAAAFPSPLLGPLEALHARLKGETGGAVASYIPELAKADPDAFAICVVTADGQVCAVGDADAPFTIQSMSKPFTYGEALGRLGAATVLRHVGVEPSGEAFNAIVFDDVHNRPFNAMVNAGAIAVAELIEGDTAAEREASLLALFGRLAGRPLAVDAAVYRSESETGHRNRAIAWMMLNAGMLRRPPEEVLDAYFRQCSVLVTCRDMGVMAATLANGGVNPVTGERALPAEAVRDVLTVMTTCGMYNYAGQWAYDVGLPAKSGVCGGVIAVAPGQAGIAVWSPPVDRYGASVRGVAACKALSETFGLHAFGGRAGERDVVRRAYRACDVGAGRLRSRAERERIEAEGAGIAVIEAQGALQFGATAALARRIAGMGAEATRVIVDFRRVATADAAAVALLTQLARDMAARRRLVFAALPAEGPLAPLRAALEAEAPATGLRFARDLERALAKAESRLLASGEAEPAAALGGLDLFAELGADDLAALSALGERRSHAAGEALFRAGDPAEEVFVLLSGAVGVFAGEGDRRRRVATVGAGQPVGETALGGGGRRTADVVAEAPTETLALPVAGLRALAPERPALLPALLGALVAILSDRLRVANAEIGSLS